MYSDMIQTKDLFLSTSVKHAASASASVSNLLRAANSGDLKYASRAWNWASANSASTAEASAELRSGGLTSGGQHLSANSIA